MQKSLFRGCFDHFEIETKGAETIVTTDHGAHGILHPAIVEVAFASGERFHKLLHGVPRRRTHAFRAFAGAEVLIDSEIEALVDCDSDALLFKVRMQGPQVACHTGARSCFFKKCEK